MDGAKIGELPQREIDDAAKEVFTGIMRNIMAANGNDVTKCWLWPSVKNWPSDWEPLPKGYSASIKGDGYGQFVLSLIPSSFRQVSPLAHVLSYRYFNLKLDPSFLSDKKYDGAEWLGKYFETRTIKVEGKDKDGKTTTTIITLRRVIRHDAKCPKHCVNPYHLTIGDSWQNTAFDELLKSNDVELSEKAVNCIESVVADFEAGEVDARALCEKHGISPADLFNIFKLKGLPTEFLGHNFNPQGHVDRKP